MINGVHLGLNMRKDLQKRVLIVANSLDKVAKEVSIDDYTLLGLVTTLHKFLKDPNLYTDAANKDNFFEVISEIEAILKALKNTAKSNFDYYSKNPGFLKKMFG